MPPGAFSARREWKGGVPVEIIAVILVVIFALVSAGDRKKKAAKRAQQQGVTPGMAARVNTASQQRPVSQMGMAERQARMAELKQKQAERAAQKAAGAEPVRPDSARASFESSLNDLKELLEVALQPAPGEGESMMADADCAGVSMPHDHAEGGSALEDEECAGGSMEHHHTQGVSRAAQNRRLSELDNRREAEEAGRLVPTAIDAAAMRRAVVMAEVLGKPKAMQGRR